ncbi:MAG: hypothetical protein ACK4M3_00165 [Pyrobaculum sp.]
MRELQKAISKAIEEENYKELSRLCLSLLKAENWVDGWKKLEKIIHASREYVLAKFMASAYVLSQEEVYGVLSPTTRDFLARDVVLCLEKTAQVIAALSPQGGFVDRHGQGGV